MLQRGTKIREKFFAKNLSNKHIEDQKREKAEEQVREIEGIRPKCRTHSGRARGKGSLLIGVAKLSILLLGSGNTRDCFQYSVAELWGFKRFEADNMN